MKFVILLALLAFTFALDAPCDPKGTNEPICFSENLNKKLRNFQDHTKYWLCEADGAKAISGQCAKGMALDYLKRECVPRKNWRWTPPCQFQ